MELEESIIHVFKKGMNEDNFFLNAQIGDVLQFEERDGKEKPKREIVYDRYALAIFTVRKNPTSKELEIGEYMQGYFMSMTGDFYCRTSFSPLKFSVGPIHDKINNLDLSVLEES